MGEKLPLAVRQPAADRKIIVAGWGWYPVWDNWTWPGREGKPMGVDVYSRYPGVRLYLNGSPHDDLFSGKPRKLRAFWWQRLRTSRPSSASSSGSSPFATSRPSNWQSVRRKYS